MDKIRIGVLSASDIAKRRFLPALKNCEGFEFKGIGLADDTERSLVVDTGSKTTEDKRERAAKLCGIYGGRLYESFNEIISDADIDALYISLPPALHYHWSMEALRAGKHLLIEKPLTTDSSDCDSIISLAREKSLCVVENYGFIYHKQMKAIKKLLHDGEIGKVRLVRAAFGFPRRREDDFRYIKKLGGGALLDCGGYTIRLARELLGETMHIDQAVLMPLKGHDVDGHGYVSAANDEGIAAQLSFGMDNQYKCELEVWGESGILYTDRIFTAPGDYVTKTVLIRGMERIEIETGSDDQFLRMIEELACCMEDSSRRVGMYDAIVRQNGDLMRVLELAL